MSGTWQDAPTVGGSGSTWDSAPLAQNGQGTQGGTQYNGGGFLQTAASNLGPSALNLANNVYNTFRHPIDTATNLGHVALGTAEKLIPGPQLGDEKYANAVGDYFKNRYGSLSAIRNSAASDPVGVLADASVPLTLGGGLLARAPGMAGEIGNVAAQAGRIADPVNTAVNAARSVPAVARMVTGAEKPAIASQLLGASTGAGANAVQGAYDAGKAGGEQSAAFLSNMRNGSADWGTVVDQAKSALANMRAQRGAAYRSGMADISKDQTVLSFDPIDKAVSDANAIKVFKGQDISPKTADIRTEINGVIDQWKALPAADYHTPEGFDALKQKLGDIRDNTQFGTPQRVVADRAYNAVREAITTQAPEYSRVMAGYQKASDQLNAVQRELSLGPKGNPNTALRKLQSTMRDNANTSFGQRTNAAQTLAANGAPNLMPSLAGQSMSNVLPRGLAGIGDLGALGATGLSGHLGGLAALPLMSPRLVGEGAHALGASARAAGGLFSKLPLPKLLAPSLLDYPGMQNQSPAY